MGEQGSRDHKGASSPSWSICSLAARKSSGSKVTVPVERPAAICRHSVGEALSDVYWCEEGYDDGLSMPK
jgi:hypothetical protein